MIPGQKLTETGHGQEGSSGGVRDPGVPREKQRGRESPGRAPHRQRRSRETEKTMGSRVTSITDNYYFQHYFNLANFGKYLIVAIAGLAAVMAIMLYAARRQKQAAENYIRRNMAYDRESYAHDPGYRREVNERIRMRRSQARKKGISIIESFYELVFSSTSILFFLSLYNIVDWHMPEVWQLWNTYKDLILVVFLMFSVLLANFLDRFLVRLPHLSDEDKGSLRLVSNIYIILIMMYIKFIYDDANYDSMIIYFVSLSLGRFIYFDFSWKDFAGTVGGLLSKLPVMGLLLIYSAFMCWYGFKVDFLLTSNGVLVSTLIAHLFMDLSIFILEKTHLLARCPFRW